MHFEHIRGIRTVLLNKNRIWCWQVWFKVFFVEIQKAYYQSNCRHCHSVIATLPVHSAFFFFFALRHFAFQLPVSSAHESQGEECEPTCISGYFTAPGLLSLVCVCVFLYNNGPSMNVNRPSIVALCGAYTAEPLLVTAALHISRLQTHTAKSGSGTRLYYIK